MGKTVTLFGAERERVPGSDHLDLNAAAMSAYSLRPF